MKWIISKDGRNICTTTVPYPKDVIKSMKAAGYKIKEIKEIEDKTEEKETKKK